MAEEVIFGGDEEDETDEQESQSSLMDEEQEQAVEEIEEQEKEMTEETENEEAVEEPKSTDENRLEEIEKKFEQRIASLEEEIENQSGSDEIEGLKQRLEAVESNTGIEAEVIEDVEERVEGLEDEYQERIESLEAELEKEAEKDELGEVKQRLEMLESNSGLEAEFIEDLEERLDGLEEFKQEISGKLDKVDDSDSGVSEEELEKVKAKIEALPNEERIEKVESELGEVKDRVAEKSDLISEVRENILERVEQLEERKAEADKLDKARVKTDNLETRIEELEESDAKDVSALEDRLESVEASISDVKWIFNDFEDLADLKLLTEDEFTQLRQTDADIDIDMETLEENVVQLQKRLEKVEDAHYELREEFAESGEMHDELEILRKRLTQLENNAGLEAEVIEELEERINDLEHSRSPNVEPLIDEIERQEEEVQDIREGYQELGEMMRVILKELRETR